MIGPGVIGSPTDVATLVVILVGLHRLRSQLGGIAAGLVALARAERSVDAAQLQAELDVDEVEVAAVQNPLPDGGDDGAD